MTLRTAAYARYSSDAQRDSSIDDQIRNIEEYCRRMGWAQPVIYEDKAISGARSDRPGYQAMLDAAVERRFDVLLVDELSRLSRDHIEGARVGRLLQFHGIRLIGVTDAIDTNMQSFKLLAGVRGLLNEQYLDDLASETHRGMMGLVLQGYNAGGLPYGYSSVPDGGRKRLVVNPEEADWVRWIFERYVAGDSPRTIAAELNRLGVASPRRNGKWSPNALYPDAKGVGLLGNSTYVGKLVWNKTKWIKDPVTGRRRRRARPASEWVVKELPDLRIISDALWAETEARIRAVRSRTSKQRQESGRTVSGGRGPGYLFSGLMRCGVCGGAYIMVDKHRYGCAMHRDRGSAACPNALKVPRKRVEDLLLQGIKHDLLSDDAFKVFEDEVRRILVEAQPDPREAARNITGAETEIKNIMAAIRQGVVTPTTLKALQDAEAELQAAQDHKREIERLEPMKMIPQAREAHRKLVSSLERVEDVASVRKAIGTIVGEIRLVPEGGELVAEMTNAGLAGVCQLTLVAGARFELATFGL